MKFRAMVVLTAMFSVLPLCKADSIPPFGVASAFNLVALGTVDASGNTIIAGNISTSADITGRMAAAGQILTGTTVASSLVGGNDPFGSLTPYSIVAAGGFGNNPTFNIDNNGGHSSVYSPSGAATLNFNPVGSGTLVTSGGSGIDFDTLRTTLENESLYLGAYGTLGKNTGLNSSGQFVLTGTDPNLNVFDVTAAEFGSVNNPLDIIVPTGSTVVINVAGTTITAGASILLNGQQNFVPNNTLNQQILINFPDATSISVTNGQLDASVLAPFATISGNQDMDGNIIAAQIDSTGEVHNLEFDGTLPTPPGSPVPEPGTLAMVGTGIISVAGILRRKSALRVS